MTPVKTDRQSARRAKIESETIRHWCLLYLDTSRPGRMSGTALLALISDIYPGATHHDLERELDYLQLRGLCDAAARRGHTYYWLTADGIDHVADMPRRSA